MTQLETAIIIFLVMDPYTIQIYPEKIILYISLSYYTLFEFTISYVVLHSYIT